MTIRVHGAPRGRDVTRNINAGDPFDRAVELILGPRMPGDDPERRRSEALALAAAAMRAAGESVLANMAGSHAAV